MRRSRARRRRAARVPRGRTSGSTAATDVVGVEIGGALKNIIAIAAGVVEGLGLGHNALAALITRGLAEITRLACAAGGRRETLAGLSGLGDLVLTCTGSLSRNRHVGVELARGRPLAEVLAGMKMVAEGVRTTTPRWRSARKHGVELPIAAQMAEVLAGACSAAAARRGADAAPAEGRTGSHDRSWVFSIASAKGSPTPSSRSSSGSTRSSRRPTRRAAQARPIDVDTIEALEELLISADVGVAGDRAHRRGRRSSRPRRGEEPARCWSRTRSARSSRRSTAPRGRTATAARRR